MKKILLIDDAESGKRISKWKRLASGHGNVVCLSESHQSYITTDAEGNNIQLLFKHDDFHFVFFHDSQGSDRVLPSNVIDILRLELLRDRFIRFSGSLESNYDKRTLARETLEENFHRFITESIILEEWLLPVAYGRDYKRILYEGILENLERDQDLSKLFLTKEMRSFLKLNRIDVNSAKYSLLIGMNILQLADELHKLS